MIWVGGGLVLLFFGRAQDAADVLHYILNITQLQALTETGAEVQDGGVFLGYTPSAAQIHLREGALSARQLVLEATSTRDEAGRRLRTAPLVLVLRVQPWYERAGARFWVDTRVDWESGSYTVTLDRLEMPTEADYDVQAFVVHIHRRNVGVDEGMRSGHYVAYFKHGDRWYEADDSHVRRLERCPRAFPYLIFLARGDRARGRTASSLLAQRAQYLRQLRLACGASSPRTPRASGFSPARPGVVLAP